MQRIFGRLFILKIYLIIFLSAFFFSYLLVPNPEPTQQIQGQYYGEYIWPVGVMLHQTWGDVGWFLFSYSMSVWFIYAFPVFVVGQGVLQIPIPFSPTPYITQLPWPSIFQWGVLFFLVLFYNYLIIRALPHVFRLLVMMARGAKYAQLGNPDKDVSPRGHLIGQETEV